MIEWFCAIAVRFNPKPQSRKAAKPQRRKAAKAQSRKACPLTITIPIGALTKDKPMTIDEQQPDKQQEYVSPNVRAWKERLERLRSMSDEEKAEYLERLFAEGRRTAHLMLRQEGVPDMTREEVRDLFAKEYPGLTLSDQIIEDRKMWYERQASHTAQAIAPTEDKPMTIDEQQPNKQEPAAQNETASEWEDPIERLRRMSDEDKAEYLERMFAEGRRRAHLMLGHYGPSTLSREEVRDLLAKKYPGLTLSDQIIEDRRARL